jgi:hypothetical protein
VGQRPYGPDEVATVLGAEILGVIADDPRAALALEGDGSSVKRLRRSAMARTALGLAEVLARGSVADAGLSDEAQQPSLPPPPRPSVAEGLVRR